MGMDFIALLEHSGVDNLGAALKILESNSAADELVDVEALWSKKGGAKLGMPCPVWIGPSLAELLPHRPLLPNLQRSLYTQGNFFLTFGDDAVCLYHCLRWAFFVTDPEWQRVMIAAVRHFAGLLQASDCILTCDFSEVYAAFFEGRSFAESIRAAGPNDFERSSIAELRQLQETYDDNTQTAVGYWRPFKLSDPAPNAERPA